MFGISFSLKRKSFVNKGWLILLSVWKHHSLYFSFRIVQISTMYIQCKFVNRINSVLKSNWRVERKTTYTSKKRNYFVSYGRDVIQVCFFYLSLTKIKLHGTEACHFLRSAEQRAQPYPGKEEAAFKRLFVLCRSTARTQVEFLHDKCFAWLTMLLLKI